MTASGNNRPLLSHTFLWLTHRLILQISQTRHPLADDNQRLRETVQARLDEKVLQCDTLLAEKTKLEREHQNLTIKVTDVNKRVSIATLTFAANVLTNSY